MTTSSGPPALQVASRNGSGYQLRNNNKVSRNAETCEKETNTDS